MQEWGGKGWGQPNACLKGCESLIFHKIKIKKMKSSPAADGDSLLCWDLQGALLGGGSATGPLLSPGRAEHRPAASS